MDLVPLKSVAKIVMGTAPPGASYNTSGEGIPMIAGAGDYGVKNPCPKKWTTQASAKSKPGDLIVCVRATIGDLNWSDKEYCLGRGVAAIRPRDGGVDIRYLGHFIQANKSALSKLGAGSTFLAIRRGDIENFEVPLPPLSEQKRIADILDKADAIRRKRQKIEAASRTLFKATFYRSFGRDFFSRRDCIPLESLIDQERGISYGVVQRGTHNPDGVPVARISNIVSNEFDDSDFVRVDQEISDQYKRSVLIGGEILVSIRGTVGRAAIAPVRAAGWNVTREVAVIPLRPEIPRQFIHQLILTDEA